MAGIGVYSIAEPEMATAGVETAVRYQVDSSVEARSVDAITFRRGGEPSLITRKSDITTTIEPSEQDHHYSAVTTQNRRATITTNNIE